MKLRSAVPALALVAGALGLGVAGAAPAGAHSGGGTIVVEQVHPAGTSIHYIVVVTWDNDGHPAADATVTATPVGGDGAALTPVTLAPSGAGDGRYSGAVAFPQPGDWTVRFTSIDPTGTVDQAQTVEPPPTTAAEPDDGSTGGSPTTAAADGGFAPADDGTGDSVGAADPTTGDDDGGSVPVLLIVLAAVVALGGVVTAVLAIRKNRPDLVGPAAAGPTGSTEPGAATDPHEGDDGEGDSDGNAPVGPGTGTTP